MKCLSLLFLLKILGLEPLFNFDPFPNFRDNKHYKLKVFTNLFYTILIMLLLLYQPLLETILTIKYSITNIYVYFL